jgi:biopolymer transport protein ExbB/TolQ
MSETIASTDPHATGRKLAKIGAWMQLALLIGVAGSVIGMMQAFDALEASAPGVGDPTRLSAAIGHVLWSTLIGFVISVIGGILICIALLGTSYRSRWFFWFLILDGLVHPFGIFFIVFALIKRQEFFTARLGTTSA